MLQSELQLSPVSSIPNQHSKIVLYKMRKNHVKNAFYAETVNLHRLRYSHKKLNNFM